MLAIIVAYLIFSINSLSTEEFSGSVFEPLELDSLVEGASSFSQDTIKLRQNSSAKIKDKSRFIKSTPYQYAVTVLVK